jgi:hypothetical protein
VLERRSWDIEVSTADIVHSFVINQEGAVGVLDRGVGGENSVIWLDDCCRNAGTGVHREFQLGFLAIVGGKALEEERTET